MSVKVSVVVPVFNPGTYIEPCIESLLAQTMPTDELELIFVDDASYDASFARLQRLEAEHRHVRAITIPRSGWPGKPRNVGTDAATGDYVMYVDQDDRLDPEALQRMYDLGAANGADIVLGKVTSDFRGVHQYLYRENRDRCTVYDERLINSQTPHKMLRRQFLIDSGIRYPEGRRRLEDQLFITRAYFAARSCAIVADYVCYRYLRRPDGGNAGSWRIDPEQYFANLRDVLDVIDAAVEPGPVRDHFYRRFLRVEMLGKLSGRRVRSYPADIGTGWLTQIRSLLEERYPLSVDQGLAGFARTRAHLARHATFAELQDLTERTRDIQPVVRVDGVHAAGAGRLRLDLSGRYEIGGSPLLLEPDGSGGWLLPTALTGDVDSAFRGVEDPSEMTADVVVAHRESGDEWFLTPRLPVRVEAAAGGGEVRFGGSVALDPSTAAGGRPLTAGVHDLMLRVEALGLSRLRAITLSARSSDAPSPFPGVVARSPRSLLEVSRTGRLSLKVDVPAKSVRRSLRPLSATWTDDRLRVELAGSWWSTPKIRATLTSPQGVRHDLRLGPDGDDRRRWLSSADAVPPGRYALQVHLTGSGSLRAEHPVIVARSARRYARALGRRVRALGRRTRTLLGRLRRRGALRVGGSSTARLRS